MDSDEICIGGKTIQPPRRINSLQSIMKLRPIKGCQWSTIAFVLNRDMIKPDGTLDDLHAIIFPLGSFYDEDEAEKHAKNVMSITGHPGVVVARYGAPVKLTTQFDPENTVEVTMDPEGRIKEMESAQYKKDKEKYEERIKLEEDIAKEADEENNPDSIEHFKRQCYLAIKNRSKYQMFTKEADEAWQDYKKRETAVREHYYRHPEHEEQFLPYLKDKLQERGEMQLYLGIETAYKELRDELLGLLDSSGDEYDNPNNSKPEDRPNNCNSNSEDEEICSIIDECDNGVCLINSNPKCENGVCSVTTDNSESNDEIMPPETFITMTSNKNTATMPAKTTVRKNKKKNKKRGKR